jgi:hypothetical protein
MKIDSGEIMHGSAQEITYVVIMQVLFDPKAFHERDVHFKEMRTEDRIAPFNDHQAAFQSGHNPVATAITGDLRR